MSLATKVFYAIDSFFDPFQNPRKKTKEHMEKVSNANNIVYNEKYPDVCLMDTYVAPRKDVKYPVIIEIHGGGFVAGDKKYRSCISAWFAVHTGAFVINANYGLAPQYTFPEPVYQVASLLDWVADNAEELNLDVDRVLITGDSAGGYYSSYLAALTANPVLQERLDIHPRIKAFATVLNCGIYDVRKTLENKKIRLIADSICFDFAGIKLDKLEEFELKDIISPIDFIDENYPQSYIIYAKKDIFCLGQGQEFIHKLEDFGIRCDNYGSTSFFDNHTFSLTWSSRAAKKVNTNILNFMNELFYGSKDAFVPHESNMPKEYDETEDSDEVAAKSEETPVDPDEGRPE